MNTKYKYKFGPTRHVSCGRSDQLLLTLSVCVLCLERFCLVDLLPVLLRAVL